MHLYKQKNKKGGGEIEGQCRENEMRYVKGVCA